MGNAFPASGANAFTYGRGNARGGGYFLCVGGGQSTTWEGSDGSLKSLWKRQTDLSAQWAWDSGAAVTDIVLSSDGGLFCCGQGSTTWDADASNAAGPGTSAGVWRLDRDGVVLWAYSPLATPGAEATTLNRQIARSDSGVYLAETNTNTTTRLRGVHKIDASTGTLLWRQDFDGGDFGAGPKNVASPIVAKPGGGVYAIVPLLVGSNNNVAAVESDGSASRLGGTGAFAGAVGDMAYWSGALIIGGASTGPSDESVVKINLSPFGQTWRYRAHGGTIGVAINGRGIYLAGTRNNTYWTHAISTGSGTSAGGPAASVIHINHAGVLQWAWDSGGNTDGIAVDPAGNITVSGTGSTTWKADVAGTAGSGATKNAWLLDPSGTVLATFNSGQPLRAAAGG